MLSTLDLVDLAKNRKNFPGHFFKIFGAKVETFKEFFLKVTKISHSQFFDILWPLCPSTTVPKKFIDFLRVINFLDKCPFLDLADFWLIFSFLSASKFEPSYLEN